MKCKCGGWKYCTVAEVEGKERVVVRCSDCGDVQPIRRDTPIVTAPMLPKVAMGRVWQ